MVFKADYENMIQHEEMENKIYTIYGADLVLDFRAHSQTFNINKHQQYLSHLKIKC